MVDKLLNSEMIRIDAHAWKSSAANDQSQGVWSREG